MIKFGAQGSLWWTSQAESDAAPIATVRGRVPALTRITGQPRRSPQQQERPMAAVAQHQQPKAMSADELARSLRAHLERRGVLRGLTARLRRDITLEVRGQRGDGPQPSSSQQRLRDSVIAEALRTQHTGNAYAVFVPESSLGEERACLI